MLECKCQLPKPITINITFKGFPSNTLNMATSSLADFFYYSMRCQEEDTGKVLNIGKVIENADWESFGSNNLITKSSIAYQIIIRKKENGIYYGYIIRSKDVGEFVKTDYQKASIEEIEGIERIAERRRDLGHFAFVVLPEGNELLFLTEVGYMIPGMVKITEFFEKCFAPNKFFYEPRKNRKQSIIPKIKVKTYSFP